MHNLTKQSYLFEHQQRVQFADLERQRLVKEALAEIHPPALSRIGNFVHILNHLRHIRIEVTFNYQEARPETAGC